jgi:hypothetical protein
MTTFIREDLSAGVNGAYINLTTSGTPGNLIHTATNTAGEKDEVYLWGVNNTQTEAAVAIEWGGTDNVTDRMSVGIPASSGELLLIAGRTLSGGLAVRAFSDLASATVSGVNIGGFVNRISVNG